MDWKRVSLFVKGYTFLARNVLAGVIINKLLDVLAWLDYRMLILLSMWHPDMGYRIKYLRKRGVHVGEHCFIDLGVFIEVTTPQAVIIEDYVSIGYGATIYAHDASLNVEVDLPMRVKTTRLCYNCAIGTGSIIMPGVRVGSFSGVAPGSVVTKDVPDNTVVAGHPAEVLISSEELGLAWQEDMRRNPDIYYDNPNEFHPPTTPFDHLITWRQEGIKVKHWTDLRTGTPFDYILEYKALKRKEEEGKSAGGGTGKRGSRKRET